LQKLSFKTNYFIVDHYLFAQIIPEEDPNTFSTGFSKLVPLGEEESKYGKRLRTENCFNEVDEVEVASNELIMHDSFLQWIFSEKVFKLAQTNILPLFNALLQNLPATIESVERIMRSVQLTRSKYPSSAIDYSSGTILLVIYNFSRFSLSFISF
jgi:hypothetical protein